MPTHRFEIGSDVTLNTEWPPPAKPGRYTVEAQMPPLGTFPQYRIKSEAEDFRRVVVEYQLTRFLLGSVAVPSPASAPEGTARLLPGEED